MLSQHVRSDRDSHHEDGESNLEYESGSQSSSASANKTHDIKSSKSPKESAMQESPLKMHDKDITNLFDQNTLLSEIQPAPTNDDGQYTINENQASEEESPTLKLRFRVNSNSIMRQSPAMTHDPSPISRRGKKSPYQVSKTQVQQNALLKNQ